MNYITKEEKIDILKKCNLNNINYITTNCIYCSDTNNYKYKINFSNFLNRKKLPHLFKRNPFVIDNIKNYLHSVFDSIILRDVVERLGLKDTSLFDLLLQYIIDTTGREFSATNVINFLKSEGRTVSSETIYVYLEALQKALIINKVFRYDVHGKAILKTLNKYYMTDLGIAQIKNNNFEINKVFAIENVVYNELLFRGYDVFVGKTKNGEVDFIATKSEEKIYIQVTYLLIEEETIKREFGVFKDIDDNYLKYVISLDKCNFSRDEIIHKNIIDWLLED